VAIDKNVFTCGAPELIFLVFNSEHGLTREIIKAGYNIDSMLI
jgi:hypothetical protein